MPHPTGGIDNKRMMCCQVSAPDSEKFPGRDGVGEIPVPIPNTAVKPHSADGTAPNRGGRVGRRRDYIEAPLRNERGFYIINVLLRRS